MVFKEKDPLREIFEEWIKSLAAIDYDTSRHAANDLLIHIPVYVRMEPEETNVLFWDLDLIREGFSGPNMYEGRLE
jgi:hypothetical protein